MEFGAFLKESRLARGITLEAVEEETKIRKYYIEALENEDFSVLPAKVYACGFVKRYAQFLNINQQQVLDAFTYLAYGKLEQSESEKKAPSKWERRSERKEAPKREQPTEIKEFSMQEQLPEISENPKREQQSDINELIIRDRTLERSEVIKREQPTDNKEVFIRDWPLEKNEHSKRDLPHEKSDYPKRDWPSERGEYPKRDWSSERRRAERKEKKKLSVKKIAIALIFLALAIWLGNMAVKFMVAKWQDRDLPSTVQSDGQNPLGQQLHIEIEADDKSWLTVIADGELVFSQILNPEDDKAEFYAHQSIYILAGNAGGLSLRLNGDEIPPLGAVDEIADREFTLADILAVESS